jgi:hypothetical protein
MVGSGSTVEVAPLETTLPEESSRWKIEVDRGPPLQLRSPSICRVF